MLRKFMRAKYISSYVSSAIIIILQLTKIYNLYFSEDFTHLKYNVIKILLEIRDN